MKTLPAIVSASVERVRLAALKTLSDFHDGLIEDEISFTNTLRCNISEKLDGYQIKGVRWTAKILTDHGDNSQERRHGADFIGLLAIDIADYRVSKGFLAQAKRVGPRGGIDDRRRLQDQCRTMLDRSPASFAFLYSQNAIRIAPALSVVSTQNFIGSDTYTRDITSFFKDHFECFLGDRTLVPPMLQTPSGEPLGRWLIERLDELKQKPSVTDQLLQEAGVQNLLALIATDKNR